MYSVKNSQIRSYFWSVFSPNTEKYGPGIIPYLDTFHAVMTITTAQKTPKFSIKEFFSKCDQIRRFLRIWSHLLKESLMDNFIFLCSVHYFQKNYLREPQNIALKKFNFLAKVVLNCCGSPKYGINKLYQDNVKRGHKVNLKKSSTDRSS